MDDAKVAAAGVRKLTGKRLVLYTDLPSSAEVDGLPNLFEQAFPQWCEYFHVDPARHADWQMTGFLMKDKARFQKLGLIPGDLPPFRHGYSRRYDLWLYEQETDYYRRHLLLHEGTHGFMNTVLGALGPPWYAEGLAELMGTHRLREGRLTLNYLPASREEVPGGPRIRIVKDAFAARRAMRLRGILEYSATAHLETEPYGWCWAAAAFLDRHPRYQDRFHQLYKFLPDHDVTAEFYRLLGDDWPLLAEEWQVFVAGIEYGHDVARAAIDFTPGRPMAGEEATVQVAADRGWQNTGLRLSPGTAYHLTATGRYQVGTKPQIWWCEPGGVSLRYYQGRPLGILLAAVRPEKPAENAPSVFLRPAVVGLGTTVMADHAGTLYLKVNHSAGELSDNSGELKVRIQRKLRAD